MYFADASKPMPEPSDGAAFYTAAVIVGLTWKRRAASPHFQSSSSSSPWFSGGEAFCVSDERRRTPAAGSVCAQRASTLPSYRQNLLSTSSWTPPGSGRFLLLSGCVTSSGVFIGWEDLMAGRWYAVSLCMHRVDGVKQLPITPEHLYHAELCCS